MFIKAMLQAIPTFAMGTTLCWELEMICVCFWWKSPNNKQGIHWKSWEWLCKPKEEGGMGFRRFGIFNQALVAKQVWRMMVHPDSLVAQVFKARYFRSSNILQMGLGTNPSFVWRSLCWGRQLIREGLGWNVVNGKEIDAGTRAWYANWAVSAPSTCIVPNQKVAAYIDGNGK